MRDKEFIEKECSRCKNRENTIDLCVIYRDMNGRPKCVNLEEKDDMNGEGK